MSKLEEIRGLFPVRVDISAEMIEKGRQNIGDPKKCIGALALGSILDQYDVEYEWGNTMGVVWFDRIDRLSIESYLDDMLAPMMGITEPITVEFRVEN